MIEQRNLIIKNIFKNKEDKVVRCPVAFKYLIENIMGNLNINKKDDKLTSASNDDEQSENDTTNENNQEMESLR
jgi:hypothetical protein